MPANKKPRKKYRPKFPPGQIVLPKNIRYSQANELMLQLIPHQELERLRDGTADEGTWHTLTMRLDWGLFMAIDHFEDDVAKTAIREGLEALLSIKDRNAKLAKWGASGSEFKAIGLALNLTDEMQSRTTRREQDDSLQAMLRLNDALLKEGQSGLVDVGNRGKMQSSQPTSKELNVNATTTLELGPTFETFVPANKRDAKGRHIGFVVGLRDNGVNFYAWVQNARYLGNGEWVEFGVQQRSRCFDSLKAANIWAYATARERIAKLTK